jgi:predicted transcriptional regulator
MGVRLRKRERDRLGIVAEILEMARDGALKSNIMWKAGLSYFMLNGYLKLMTDTKLLGKQLLDEKILFKTTDKGLKFLYHCYEIIGLLETEEEGNKLYGRIRLLPATLTPQVQSNLQSA